MSQDESKRSLGGFQWSRRVLMGLAALGLAVFLLLTQGYYTIDQGEIGVQLRNGAITGTAEPGFHIQVPFIDSVARISVRNQARTFEGVQSYSKDIQPADLRITVAFHVDASRVLEVYSEYGSLDGLVDRIVTPTLFSETKIVFGSFNAATAISERGRLVAEIERAIRTKIEGHPIIIETVQIEDIAFSRAFEDSVEQRMLAEVEVQKLEQNLKRERVQADIVRAQAQAQADATLAQAEAEANATRLRGEAEASAIKAKGDALRDNPQLVELITAEKWDGQLPVTMVPGATVPFIEIGR